MKLFTITEANDLLPVVRPKLEKIKALYDRLEAFRDSAKAASAAGESGGGGMEGGSAYVQCLYEIGKLTTELGDTGIQLKDYSRGLIDFPSMREDRVVLLCWQLGEGDELQWWHELEAGFIGRQPL
jgi:hypothetical protein